MSMLSSFYKSKQVTPSFTQVSDDYGAVRKPLVDWLGKEVGQVKPYGGDLTSESTAQEKQSLDFLKNYVEGGPGQGTTQAQDQITKTMSGEYDPTTSGYYQAVKAESARNLAEAQKSIADNAAGGGRYWGGARLKEQGNAANDAAIAMNKELYGMQETERERMLNAVPMAMQLGQNQENAALNKTGALQTYGGIERNIGDANKQAVYNEWVASNRDYPLQVAQTAAGVQQAPTYAQNQYQASPFERFAMPLATAAIGGWAGKPTATKKS